MGRTTHTITELAGFLFKLGLLGENSRRWHSGEGMVVEFFSRDQAEALNSDLELRHKMPGWCIIGQDEDDLLLCYDYKSGKCSMIEADHIGLSYAQELTENLGRFLEAGRWESS